jgi:uncharacterized oligopeptide transporter (OPT) family protein
MKQNFILFGCASVLIVLAAPAHAYLAPLIGLVGAIGGVAAAGVTAVLSVVFLIFFHGRQLKRFLSGKKSAAVETDQEKDVDGGVAQTLEQKKDKK